MDGSGFLSCILLLNFRLNGHPCSAFYIRPFIYLLKSYIFDLFCQKYLSLQWRLKNIQFLWPNQIDTFYSIIRAALVLKVFFPLIFLILISELDYIITFYINTSYCKYILYYYLLLVYYIIHYKLLTNKKCNTNM